MDILEPAIKIVLWIVVLLVTVINVVWAERRLSAVIQARLGPNRVGPFGLFQGYADVLKLLLKEDIVPKNAYKPMHDLAPILCIGVALTTFAVVPWGDTITIFGNTIKCSIADVNIGILFILAMTSLGVYGLTLAGWSSNNKYSLLGGLRSSAQMISYEVSMGLSIVGVLMITGTLQLNDIVKAQTAYIGGWLPKWNIFLQPIAFITFLVASFAETNRLPFDLPEAEPELVGGYHTEYTGLKFGLFFLSEYANMITSSAVIVTLFLGGWSLPYIEKLGISEGWMSLIKIGTFIFKTVCLIVFFIMVRWTLPRFRYDQLMKIGWKVMLPIALGNIIVTGFLILFVS